MNYASRQANWASLGHDLTANLVTRVTEIDATLEDYTPQLPQRCLALSLGRRGLGMGPVPDRLDGFGVRAQPVSGGGKNLRRHKHHDDAFAKGPDRKHRSPAASL